MEELGIIWKYPEKGMFWIPQQRSDLLLVVMVEDLALWTVLTIKKSLISFEIWKLGDNHWGKCGLRHSVKPSSSGDCVHKLFMSVQLESCASTVLVLEKHP